MEVETRKARLTVRAVMLGLVCQIAILFWVVRSEVTGRVFLSSWSLPMPGILLLLIWLAFGSLLRRRRWTPAELLTGYVFLSTTILIVGYDCLQLLFPSVGAPFYLATPENGWARLHYDIPRWLAPRDPEVLKGLFLGHQEVPWGFWWRPLLAWGSLLLAFGCMTLSVALLLAPLWIQRERLVFPTTALALEMAVPRTNLFRNPAMWIGFAIPAVFQSLLAIREYLPWVPAVVLKYYNLSDIFVNVPWTALRPLSVGFTPFILGLAFLAPTEVSLSIWFFYWCGKFQRFLAVVWGRVDPSDLGRSGGPHLDDQCVGAFVAFGLFLLVRVWQQRQGVAGGPKVEGSRIAREGYSGESGDARKWVWLGLGLSVSFILAFLHTAGLPLLVSGGIVGLYLLFVVGIARVRAEAGFAWTYGPHRSVASLTQILFHHVGSIHFSRRTLSLLGFFHWFWWDLRFALMPAQMEGLKLGEGSGLRPRALAGVILLAMVVAIGVGSYATAHDSYLYGWATAKVYGGVLGGARVGPTLALQEIDFPTDPDWVRTAWAGIGGAMTLLLLFLHQRWVWWPFHPVGWVMSNTPTAEIFWFFYFLAWVIKVLLLRYGGMRLYRQSLPLVLGFMLGDVITQTLWSLVCSLLDVPVYRFVA